MALTYCDTSALAKLFVIEPGSEQMNDLTELGSGHMVAVFELTRIELHSAIRRREARAEVPEGTTLRAREILDHCMSTRYVTQGLTRSVMDRACELIDRHLLKAADAMQLAGALELASQGRPTEVVFVSSDRSLLRAAGAEELATFDPCNGG